MMAGGSWSRVESAVHASGGLRVGVGGCESTVLPEEEVAGESGHVSGATVGWSVPESSEANDGCWNMPMSSGVGVGDSSEIVVSRFECFWGGYSDRAWELNNSSSES
jgi:hypothetical protein